MNITITQNSKRNRLGLYARIYFLLLLFISPLLGQGQTYYPLSTGDYVENFADIATWTTVSSSGRAVNYFSSVGVNSTGTIPDGIRTTVSSAAFTSSSSGGVQKGTQNLAFLSTGTGNNTAAVAVDLNLNFAGRTAGSLAFDYAQVNNQTGDRPSLLRVYYSTDGTTFTEIAGTTVTVNNNVASSGTINVLLPRDLDGAAMARLRFYNHNGPASGTGSRPKIAVDNISVTSTASGSAITTGAVTGAPVCATAAADITVAYSTSGAISGTYTVQLSNAAGTFPATPTTLATVSSTSTALTVTVPAGTASSTGYKVRVINSNGATPITGSASAAFTVVSNPTVTISPTPTATTGQNTPVSFSGVETPAATSREWLYGTAPNTYSTATGTTTLAYDFPATTPGIYYVVLRSVFPGCGTITSAATQVTVTAPTTPTITVTASLAAFNTVAGVPSAAQSFKVEGNSLIDDIKVGPTTGYEFSATGVTTDFAASQSLARTGSDLPLTTVYVRLTGNTATAALGLSIPVTSTGAAPRSVTVTGTVVAEPTVAPSVMAGTPTTSGVGLTVSGGNGTKRLLVIRPAASAAVVPTDQTTYSANPAFGTLAAGTTTGPNNYVVLNGTSLSASITNLVAGTAYVAEVYAYNETTTAGFENYLASPLGSVSFTTSTAALLTYNFTVANAVAASSDANISGSAVTASAELSMTNGNNTPDFRRSDFPQTATLTDLTKGYFEFVVTVGNGYQATLTSLNLLDRRSGTGPVNYELRTSLDNFAGTVGAQQTTGAAFGTIKTITLSGTAGLATVSGAVTFRLYAYGATGTGGTFGVDDVQLFGSVQILNDVITAPAFTGTAFCAGASFDVKFTPTAAFTATNDFVVQLSSAAGSFAAPVVVGTAPANATSGAQVTLGVTLPAATATGSGYLLRVVSTDPALTSASSVAFAVVNSPTVAVTPAGEQTISANASGAPLTALETPAATARQWVYSATPGGATTPISGAMATSYTPTFPAAGDYYVKVVSTFAACGLVTSNEVKITVTAATPSLTATTSPDTSPTAISGLTTSPGAPSASKTYTLLGANLGATAVRVTAPAGFQVSATAAFTGITTDANTLTLNPTSGGINQIIYVRLTGTSTGSYSGTVSNTSGTLSAAVLVSGEVTTAVVAKWDGGGDKTSFADPLNWSNDVVPTTGSDILLDHTHVSGAYTMTFPAAATGGLSLGSLAIDPTGGASITAVLPASNTAVDYLRFTKATEALVIRSGGVFINNSGAASGGTGNPVDVTPAGQNFIISNGGAYVHRTPRGVGLLLDNISTASGTETGVFQYDVPSGSSYSISATGRTYGSLALTYPATSTLPASGFFPYLTSGSNAFVIRGTLTTGANVSFAVSLNNDISVAGNLVNNGRFRFEPASLATPRRLILNGTAAQTISGSAFTQSNTGTSYLGLNVILQISNPAGVTLATGVVVNAQGNANSGGLELLAGVLTTSGTAMLKLAADAVLLPAVPTAASYVNGPLQREVLPTPAAVAAAYLFPIGQNGQYRPLTLNVTFLDALTTFTATQNDAAFPDRRLNGDLTRVSRVRYFSVVPNVVPTAFAGTITLSFGGDDQVTDPSLSSFVIGKNSGNGWDNIGRTTSTATSLSSASFTAFSDFALASTDPAIADNPLPVSLTRFTAERQQHAVAIRWTTASEANSARFEVQRSLTGQEFSMVAVVAGQGQSSHAQRYTVIDQPPGQRQLYYRLRQIDLDGKTSISPVVVVHSELAVEVFPNPVQNVLTIQGLEMAAEPLLVVLTDLTGRQLWAGNCPESRLELSWLPPGAYLLQIRQGERQIIRRILRAH